MKVLHNPRVRAQGFGFSGRRGLEQSGHEAGQIGPAHFGQDETALGEMFKQNVLEIRPQGLNDEHVEVHDGLTGAKDGQIACVFGLRGPFAHKRQQLPGRVFHVYPHDYE